MSMSIPSKVKLENTRWNNRSAMSQMGRRTPSSSTNMCDVISTIEQKPNIPTPTAGSSASFDHPPGFIK